MARVNTLGLSVISTKNTNLHTIWRTGRSTWSNLWCRGRGHTQCGSSRRIRLGGWRGQNKWCFGRVVDKLHWLYDGHACWFGCWNACYVEGASWHLQQYCCYSCRICRSCADFPRLVTGQLRCHFHHYPSFVCVFFGWDSSS